MNLLQVEIRRITDSFNYVSVCYRVQGAKLYQLFILNFSEDLANRNNYCYLKKIIFVESKSYTLLPIVKTTSMSNYTIKISQ